MQEVKIHAIYRHHKGDLYLVEDIATHTETGERMVLYRALYGDCRLWCRPYDMFLEELNPTEYPNATQKHRFEPATILSARS